MTVITLNKPSASFSFTELFKRCDKLVSVLSHKLRTYYNSIIRRKCLLVFRGFLRRRLENGLNCFLELFYVGVLQFFSELVVFFSCSGSDSHPDTLAQR